MYCSEGSPQTFNPQLSTSGTTFDASSRTLYNRLVEFKPGSTLIEPALATHWTISADGKEYIFDLRTDVKFHTTANFKPTRPFNADDVLFSFERQWQKDHPFHNTSKLGYRYFESMGMGGLIESIEKISSHKIKFRLSRAESPFLASLAMDFASILSAEYAQQLAQQNKVEIIDSKPVGTGPFQLVRYQPDAYIRYKAHPDYWQGKQRLNNLVFAITPDPSLRFARLVAGECDVMANPLPVHITSAEQFQSARVISEAGLNIAYLSMNTTKPPFNNHLVRHAINHAINKNSIINAVYQKTATEAKNPIPPNMWAYNKSIKDFEFSPEKARKLLSEAGYANGFNMTISTMSAQRAYNPNAKKMAELIQQNLRDIGINVDIETYEYGAFLYKVRKGEHHSALLGWTGDNGDPDNFFTPLLSCAGTMTGTNSSFWCDPQFNQLIHQARSQTRVKSRTQLYQQAQRVFKQASPWVPIAHATQHLIINPRVKNFAIIPTGGVYFKDVYLENSEVLNDE
ncbi:ABC transporter substrate-binding protein [Aliikangiella coralliicola]|uniref:ABC transporter substrate-binding protein n=1 Tax=Aliikangiella coralliicola TaxID=2592383 RepID=UPI00143CC156|nr:ABC transporter substrate-binding protein [Aliikangiella coralliicola]